MTNLCSVLAAYGMSAYEGVLVIDKTEERDTSEEDADGEAEETDVEYTFVVNVNPQHDITEFAFDSEYLFTANSSNSLKLDATKREDLIITELLTTSADAYIENSENKEGEKHVVAAAAEIACGGRVVWFTGADAYNVALETTESFSDAYLAFCGIHWTSMNYASSLGEIPMTVYELPPIIVSEKTRTMTTFAMMFAIPAAVLGCGAAVVYKRKKESKITH